MFDCPHKIKKLVDDELWFLCSENENRLCVEEYESKRCPIAEEWMDESHTGEVKDGASSK